MRADIVAGPERDLDWAAARDQLLSLKDDESVSFTVNGDTWLIVLRIEALGYLVTGCGLGDRDYFTLIERSRGDDPVEAFDGGNMNEYPRHTFVSEAVLLKAVEVYYLTGKRGSDCEWVPAEDSVY